MVIRRYTNAKKHYKKPLPARAKKVMANMALDRLVKMHKEAKEEWSEAEERRLITQVRLVRGLRDAGIFRYTSAINGVEVAQSMDEIQMWKLKTDEQE